ncbi:MAG TPA: MFS transporter [Steroidobacteraceae bacterium]|nr:MFS transporter [Steroidobacteraceae bacterium]
MNHSGPSHPAAAVYPDGLPVPRRYWSILAVVLAISMSVLDSSIANVALPSIARDFHASAAASIWVINAYTVAILVALLPLASLGEIIGYRRVSQAGMLIFTLASLGCAFSRSLPALSLARVVQGLGAAGIMSVNAALVRFTYPQHMLGRAIGINAFAVAVSAAIGPSVASAVLSVASWPWLFGINVPIGILTFAIAFHAFPETPHAHRPLNFAGTLLNVGAFGLLLSGLQALAHDTVTTLAVLQMAAGGLLALALVRHEIHRAAPIVPFDLLKIRLFSLSLATSVTSFMAQMAGLVALPFEIQRLGHSAVETGLLMTPWPIGVAVAAPLAGRLADRHPAGFLGGVGLVMLAAGLAALALFPQDGGEANFIWRMALCGLGFGFFQTPNNRALLSAAPRARSGAAGGMLSTARLLGQTLGAAGVAILFRAFPATGSNVVLWVAACVALMAALISSLRLAPGPRAPRSAPAG